MRVGICSVGSELLSGEIADTNAAWLAQRALESGCEVAAELVVGDDRALLREAFAWLAAHADTLVVGGGLGPTADDLTRDAVADFAGVSLERREELVKHLEAVYARLERPMPPAALRQADVPAGAVAHPPRGSAAGFTLDIDWEGPPLRVHVLPGVPWEYKELAERAVLPDLVARSGGQARVLRTIHVAGLGESGVGQALSDLTDRLAGAADDPAHPEHGLDVGFLATSDEVLVRVTAVGPSPQAARERSEPIVTEAADRLGDAVTSIDERRLEDEVARLLRATGRTVAMAEGVTAGRMTASLSSVPGAADFLRGGLVAYDPETVVDALGLDATLVSRHGLVSEEVAREMARVAQRRLAADYAVAVTGVAEGGNDADPPAGTIVWAVASLDGDVKAQRRHIPAGDQEIIQVRGAAFALEALRRLVAAERSSGAPVADVRP